MKLKKKMLENHQPTKDFQITFPTTITIKGNKTTMNNYITTKNNFIIK